LKTERIFGIISLGTIPLPSKLLAEAGRARRSYLSCQLRKKGSITGKWIVDAHGHGNRFIVRADGKLTAFAS
jgi:hypothetical protein